MKFDPTCRQRNLSLTTALLLTLFNIYRLLHVKVNVFALVTIAPVTNANVQPNPNPYLNPNPYTTLKQKPMITSLLLFLAQDIAGAIVAGANVGSPV